MTLEEEPQQRDRGRPRFGLLDVVLVVIGGLAIGFVAVLTVAVVVQLVRGDEAEVSNVIGDAAATALVYAGLLAAVYLLVVVRRRVRWSEIGLRAPDEGYVLKTVGLFMAVIFVNVIIATLVSQIEDPPDVREQLAVEESEGLSGAEVLWLLVASVVAAPVVEEIVFRGLLFPVLRSRWRFGAAALVSAVVFAAAHQTLLLVPALTVLGLALAWLKERYGSLYPAIVLHGLNNGLAIAVLVAMTP